MANDLNRSILVGRPSMYKNPDLYNQNVNKLFERIGVNR